MAVVKDLGIVGGIVLALLIGAFIFLGAGRFLEEFKSVGYGLLALAIIVVIAVIVVILVLECRRS